MWSYLGAKTKIIKHYPHPRYRKIIEPFCGTARYSLEHFENDVLISDKYEVIIKIWKWLQQCSPADVTKLPDMKFGDVIDDYQWDCDEAKWLLGFMIGFMTTSPRKQATIRVQQRPRHIKNSLKRISENLYKIRHWQIICDSYENIPNQQATWFIDSPYTTGSDDYIHGSRNIDFIHLADYCRTRNGQVMVCERNDADWLPFRPMIEMHGRKGFQKELIWMNEKNIFDQKQLTMF